MFIAVLNTMNSRAGKESPKHCGRTWLTLFWVRPPPQHCHYAWFQPANYHHQHHHHRYHLHCHRPPPQFYNLVFLFVSGCVSVLAIDMKRRGITIKGSKSRKMQYAVWANLTKAHTRFEREQKGWWWCWRWRR